jgi:membrane peptidoglycan carboxypeptidase
MEEDGYITSEQKILAEKQKLQFTGSPYPLRAPHFVMMVKDELDRMYSPAQVNAAGGLVVRTTLDLDWQAEAEEVIHNHLRQIDRTEDGIGHNLNSAALVALNPHTGELLALVGSPDYFDEVNAGAVNMALSPRQPGSAIKPILYAEAMDPKRSNPFTAATVLMDVKTFFITGDQRAYIPENYDRMEHGPVLVREALASSLNIPAVLTLDHIGIDALVETAQRMGISTWNDPEHYDLSLALGGGEVRLLDLTAAFGVFANGGYQVVPNTILEIESASGELLYKSDSGIGQRILDARVAWLISDILSDDKARKMGFGSNSVLNLGIPAAVKTGTTTNFHDNWTVGYTPRLVVGVWAGNTNYEPMHDVNGLAGAAPIWHTFTRSVLTGLPVQEFQRPNGLHQVKICALSGLLPTAECAFTRSEWFISGSEPVQEDYFFKRISLGVPPVSTPAIGDENISQPSMVVLDLPVSAQAWARSAGLPLVEDYYQNKPVIPISPQENSPEIQWMSPPPNSIFIRQENLDGDVQKIKLEATVKGPYVEAVVFLDGIALANFKPGIDDLSNDIGNGFQSINTPILTWWELNLGKHQVWVEVELVNGVMETSEIIHFEVLSVE